MQSGLRLNIRRLMRLDFPQAERGGPRGFGRVGLAGGVRSHDGSVDEHAGDEVEIVFKGAGTRWPAGWGCS